MRLILGDRWSAGAIAVLIAQMLLLQAVFAGLAQGAMAAPANDSSFVICALHEAVAAAPTDGDNGQAHNAPHCPCAILCQLAAATVPLVPAGFVPFDYAPAGEAAAGYATPIPASHPVVLGLTAEARGPPLFSV